MQQTTHPTDERLEAYCDGSLPAAEKHGIETHVFRCGRCRGEVEEWRALFGALASLPQHSPSPGFANRVMAQVRIPRPWHARAGEIFGRFIPHTAPGWAFALAVLGVPLLALGSLAFWLLSRSYLTGYRLWVFATDQFAHGANQAANGVFTRLMQTDVMVWLISTVGTFMDSAGVRGVSVVAVTASGAILASIWVLYRNLFRFRSTSRGSTHVSFTF